MLIRLTLLVCLAAALTAGLAVADPGDPQGPQNDLVAGSGKISFTGFPSPGETTVEQTIVSAHSGPAGEDPRGQMTFDSPLLAEGRAKAEVICMTVTGERARVGAEFAEPVQYGEFRIRQISLIVQDAGSDDLANGFAFIDRPRPPDFSPCNFDAPTLFDVQGNYEVKDGTPKHFSVIP